MSAKEEGNIVAMAEGAEGADKLGERGRRDANEFEERDIVKDEEFGGTWV